MESNVKECRMNMVFTWDYENLCVVFAWWQITSLVSFAVSLVAVVLIGVAYEAMREACRRYESRSPNGGK